MLYLCSASLWSQLRPDREIVLSEKHQLCESFTYGLSIAPENFVGRNLEQIQVEGCQPYFKPAVNRQPMFPREMTRRADSACSPSNSRSEFSHALQRTRSKNKRKHRFSVKITIFGATMKTLAPFGKCSNKFCGTSPSGKTFLKYLTINYPYSQENS